MNMMEKGQKKDWMDAVREQCLSDGATPAPGGWEAVGTKMRRAAARRRALLSAAIALPALALLLWSTWRERPVPSDPIAQVTVSDSSSVVPDQRVEEETVSQPEPVALLPQTGRSLLAYNARPVLPDDASVIPDAASVIPDSPAVIPDPIGDPDPVSVLPDTTSPSPADNPSSSFAGLTGESPTDTPDPTPRHRTRVSLGMRAGTGPTRREGTISMQSARYIAALNFLNTVDPSMVPAVKSNTINTQGIGMVADSFFSTNASGQYSHDLPLSLGLSVRVELTPRLSLESGLEYTYLHSVENFAGSRLNQQLHFVGIPVRLDASLWTKGGFGIYAGVGVKVEKCVSAKLGRVACEEPRLQWSAEAFGGVQYQLSRRTSLYFQPALSWYFTKTDLPTYRTEHPLGVTLHAGLRFDL